jgi:hypothetical protein
MANIFRFWTHGANVQVEYPKELKSLRRAGWGTDIEQAAGSSNWFHFAVPTKEDITNSKITATEIRIVMTRSKGSDLGVEATWKAVHVWDGNNKIFEDNNVSGKYKLVDGALIIDIPDKLVRFGLVVSLAFSWDKGDPSVQPNSLVRFSSVGAQFREGI